MVFQIFFTIACITAAITLTAFIVNNNKELGGKAAPGWWVISGLISQIFIVAIMAVWWKDWWVSNQWLMNVSTGLTIAGVILWAVAKIYTRRHW